MKIHRTALLFVSILAGASAANISICVQARESGSDTPLQGAQVKCYDEDLDADDAMTGTYTTGSNGCVNLSYSKKTPKWYNPCTAWDCPGYTNPDIYCVVTKTNYFPVSDKKPLTWSKTKSSCSNHPAKNLLPYSSTPTRKKIGIKTWQQTLELSTSSPIASLEETREVSMVVDQRRLGMALTRWLISWQAFPINAITMTFVTTIAAKPNQPVTRSFLIWWNLNVTMIGTFRIRAHARLLLMACTRSSVTMAKMRLMHLVDIACKEASPLYCRLITCL